MILFKNIHKFYLPDCYALKDINLRIDSGEFISIVGQSGAGKTTLLRLLIREEEPSKGKIIVNKEDVCLMSRRQLPRLRRKIGMVFQDSKLLAKRTVFENIAFAMEVAGRTDQEINQEVPQILDLVDLNAQKDNYPYQLSGGEKQKTSLARALVHRPEILVADEPTGNLDILSTWDMIQLLIKINKFGTTVILATHDKDIVNSLNKRVVTLDKGRIIRDQAQGKYSL